jgi:hypothetical protein
MLDYRCYFFDTDDHIIGTSPPAQVSAEDDMAAIRQALALCEALPKDCHSIELWCGDRMVIKHRVLMDAPS